MWILDYFVIEVKIAGYIDHESGRRIPYEEKEIEVYSEDDKDSVVAQYINHPALISIDVHRCDHYER